MAIERTPADHAQFSADMARIAASQAKKGATPTPGPWHMAPVIGEPGFFNIYAPHTKHAGQAWRIAADMTEGNAKFVVAAHKTHHDKHDLQDVLHLILREIKAPRTNALDYIRVECELALKRTGSELRRES